MRTKQEIINFLESKVGGGVECKGNPSLNSQCVTLIKSLMEFLGVPDPYKARGNAKDCINSYLSEGIADKGTGFISVFSNKNMGGGYGHVWCLPLDCTEVLTSKGFVSLSSLKVGDKVLGFDGKKIVDDEVTGVVKPRIETVIRKRQTEATAEHRFLTKTNNTKNFSVKRWDKVCNGSANYFPKGEYFAKGIDLSNEEIALLIAIQADGSYMKGGGIEFHFKKQRKIDRLTSLLNALSITYSYKKHISGNKIRIYGKQIVDFSKKYLENKNFSNDLLLMDKEQRNFFLEEILEWDGHKRKVNYNYCSKNKQNTDVVQTLLFLDGRNSLFLPNSYSIEWGNRNQYTISKNMESHERKTEISCISTKTSFFIMRQYGRIQIVGNCNAGEGNGTYYESNGVKPLICTKGKTYSYDKVCNFDKWIKEEEKENNMNELLNYLDVKDLDEAKGKLKEHLGEKDGKCGWGSNKDMGYLGSERDKNHNLYLDYQAEKQKVEKLELDLKVCKSEKEFITKDYQEMFAQNENHASLYHQELNNNLKLTETILSLEKELDQIKSERDKSLADKDKEIKTLEGKIQDLEKIIKEQGDIKDKAKLQLNGLKTALYEFIAEIYESIKKGGR